MCSSISRFLAVLELYREARVSLDQITPLGELFVSWSDAGPPGPVMIADEEDD